MDNGKDYTESTLPVSGGTTMVREKKQIKVFTIVGGPELTKETRSLIQFVECSVK